ncbi:MAG: hypothetical protein KKF79_06140 [Gammaproteobacteria bacterium]|jgi:hypothetical protein|nr:hypothetical protein [Gammaproteobacteria bacterium]MBU2279457.1 hypothetical protein [Gammaproteobacteria bacterium]MBU2426825.1 hypothetical protein [Gammaproteobacteria bacterium]
MSSSQKLKKKISKRAKQKKNIQVKNSIRLKNAKQAEAAVEVAVNVEENQDDTASGKDTTTPAAGTDNNG